MVSQGKHGQGLTPSRVTFSSSRNAVSFSSELTINLFPLSRRASAVKSARTVESMWDAVSPGPAGRAEVVSDYFPVIRLELEPAENW